MRPGWTVCFLVLGLVSLTCVAFWPVGSAEFINYDDSEYVVENTVVQRGLTGDGIAWALSGFHVHNWHPLTWLSHMLDYELFELNPAGHHWMNLVLHVANTLLLFWVLCTATAAVWPSAMVAALFAVHPLHVESVAWVSERKDVLSTFFWMLTMGAYVHYTRERVWTRYALVMLFLALGLLAKPMVVTLPCVLLLLDYWPLERLRGAVWPCVREKIPLFALVGLSSVLTVLAQQGAMQSLESLSFFARLENAAVSYVMYLRDTFKPVGLTLFYPYADPPGLAVAGALFFLACVTAGALIGARRFPYLPLGWLWYLGTLVPVIGVVQVGLQARADRYTYIPLIGIFIILVWGLTDLTARWRMKRLILSVSAAIVLLILVLLTHAQAQYWRDSISLWKHALLVTTDNYIAHTNLANALQENGNLAEARQHYNRSLEVNAHFFPTHFNFGVLLERLGQDEQAITAYRHAIALNPRHHGSHLNLGIALHKRDQISEAIEHYTQAMLIRPRDDRAYYNAGVAYEELGDIARAQGLYAAALKQNPQYKKAQTALARVQKNLMAAQRARPTELPEAQSQLRAAQQHILAGNSLAQQGQYAEALAQYAQAKKLDPSNPDTYANWGNVELLQGKAAEAIVLYQQALSIDPDHLIAHLNLANAYTQQQQYQKAQEHYQAALRIDPRHTGAQQGLVSVTAELKNSPSSQPSSSGNQPP